jgi:hypothetical protein
MPCQCGSTATFPDETTVTISGCGCETDGGCSCGSGGSPPTERELRLERLVMDLDKRLRRLESAG